MKEETYKNVKNEIIKKAKTDLKNIIYDRYLNINNIFNYFVRYFYFFNFYNFIDLLSY